MNTAVQEIAWKISSKSEESLRAVKEIVRQRSAPDFIVLDVARNCPGGIEKRVERRYLTGEYFESVEINQKEEGNLGFLLVFHVKEDAPDRYWKDLIGGILSEIRNAGATIQPAKAWHS